MPNYYDDQTKTWYVKFYYVDYTGKRKQKLKRGFKLQRDAKQFERDFLERMQGTPEMTFKSLYVIYMQDCKVRLRPSTYSGKENVFKNCILPYFESKPVNQITPADVREWQNTMIAKEYSDAYLDRLNNMLTTIFNFARQYYNLHTNPCDLAGHMGKRTRSMTFWTHDEYKKVRSHVSDPTAAVALDLLFYGGFRFGELIALTAADFDFENNTVNISKSAQIVPGGVDIGKPKTDNGFRVVTMPDVIMNEVSDYMARIYGLENDTRVFTFTKSLLNGNISRCSAAAGVQRIRIHDLRHSHVSMLIDMDFNTHLIADRIGDTVQMVNNTYGHLYPERKNDVATRLNAIL